MIAFDFSGQRVLVTGGTQNIGLAIASVFRDAGADVSICGTRANAADYDDDLSGYEYLSADLSDAAARAALAVAVGSINVLVNNAGISNRTEYAIEGFEAVMAVNLTAVADLCFKFHEGLARSKGSIINIGSSASFLALRRNPAYTASKTGLLGLTRALADQWAPDGIRVNMVAPGYIHTKMTDRVRQKPGAEAKLLEALPASRWGRPVDVGYAALFLASPLADYITGEAVKVDGGLTLR